MTMYLRKALLIFERFKKGLRMEWALEVLIETAKVTEFYGAYSGKEQNKPSATFPLVLKGVGIKGA
jgi:hypothetical protein